MKPKISDILVVSDMDGTLLNSRLKISRADLQTIRLFTELGGKFSVATGRVADSVAVYSELVQRLSPAIVCGGASIYDYEKQEVLASEALNYEVGRKILRDVLDCFGNVGAMVASCDGRVFMIEPSHEMHTLFDDEKLPYFMRPIDELPKEWNKMLFAGPPELLLDIQNFVSAQYYPDTDFTLGSPTYFEVMPKGVNKGAALVKLCEIMKVDINNCYAFGNYYNDIDLLRAAGVSVAMENSPNEIIEMCDHVTQSNDEAGVGRFLYDLIRKYT